MINYLAVIFPVAGASVAGMKPVRPFLLNLLLVIASANVSLAALFALGVAADQVVVFGWGYFVADATSRLFLLVINLVFVGIATYLWTRVRDTPELRDGIERFAVLALVFIAAANLAILSNHAIAAWVLLEVTTLSVVPLIQFKGTPLRLRASWRYFLFSSVGLAISLLGFACLARGMEASGTGEA
jgi:hydrogenase-4 component F